MLLGLNHNLSKKSTHILEMRIFALALLALNVALLYAAPQNTVAVDNAVKSSVAVVGQKGDHGDMFNAFPNDAAVVRTCHGQLCEFMTVAEAKQLEKEAIASVNAVKGETAVTKALSPTLATMSESLRSLQAQKLLLENLEASMNAMRARSVKGQEYASAANTQYAAMSKGLSFSPESKGMLAPSAPSKGFGYAPSMALPPSKGMYGAVSSAQREAMLCPMTSFELGKCQKLASEMKIQIDASTSMNARLVAEVKKLTTELAASEMMRVKAQEEAAFYKQRSEEEKAQKELLAMGLAECTTKKEALQEQKDALEVELSQTQVALSMEKAENAELTANLSQCQQDRAVLTVSLADQTARAEAAEEELATTKTRLEEEIDRAISLEESLKFTQARLAKCEEDLQQERAAREQTEQDLMKTMTDLASCQKENRVITESLSRCQDNLQETRAALARETAAREMLQAKFDATLEELRTTQEELRSTIRTLEDERNAHTTTKRILAETKAELEASEKAGEALKEANQQLSDELAETKAQLEVTTSQRDQLQVSLDKTREDLADCTGKGMKCEADLASQVATSEELSKQLGEALMMLQAEKEAREELTATIALVQETSMKVQEEVKKLQLENLNLQNQVQKLQAEQEVALALAAGCPPTYEKYGSSCYKYVREKTPWKMAQEQCMKDQGNLVAIETRQEQIFLTNYLKRHGANDPYASTSGTKQGRYWKWIDAANNHIGSPGIDYWYNVGTQSKPGYDCQAMYLGDGSNYGKWVGQSCYSPVPYICEYRLLPHGAASPSNPAEQYAMVEMAKEAPYYLRV